MEKKYLLMVVVFFGLQYSQMRGAPNATCRCNAGLLGHTYIHVSDPEKNCSKVCTFVTPCMDYKYGLYDNAEEYKKGEYHGKHSAHKCPGTCSTDYNVHFENKTDFWGVRPEMEVVTTAFGCAKVWENLQIAGLGCGKTRLYSGHWKGSDKTKGCDAYLRVRDKVYGPTSAKAAWMWDYKTRKAHKIVPSDHDSAKPIIITNNWPERDWKALVVHNQKTQPIKVAVRSSYCLGAPGEQFAWWGTKGTSDEQVMDELCSWKEVKAGGKELLYVPKDTTSRIHIWDWALGHWIMRSGTKDLGTTESDGAYDALLKVTNAFPNSDQGFGKITFANCLSGPANLTVSVGIRSGWEHKVGKWFGNTFGVLKDIQSPSTSHPYLSIPLTINSGEYFEFEWPTGASYMLNKHDIGYKLSETAGVSTDKLAYKSGAVIQIDTQTCLLCKCPASYSECSSSQYNALKDAYETAQKELKEASKPAEKCFCKPGDSGFCCDKTSGACSGYKHCSNEAYEKVMNTYNKAKAKLSDVSSPSRKCLCMNDDAGKPFCCSTASTPKGTCPTDCVDQTNAIVSTSTRYQGKEKGNMGALTCGVSKQPIPKKVLSIWAPE